MRLSGNLLAGLANSIWSALIGLAVIPFYLKYLGIEAYGLIGFFVTTQALLSLLDMGLAPTIIREVARHSASANLKEAGALLHTLAIIYWSMAGVIALLVLVFAPLIAEYWLQSKQLSPQTISHAVMLMGLVIACRWPIGLYQGALIGAQRLAVSSGINMVMTSMGSLGAVVVLAFVSPTIEAFFIWQACVGFVYAVTMRWGAWRIIGRIPGIRFDINKLKSICRFSAGMSGVALSGIVFTQLDKVILSKMLGLEEFGHYMLATVVVSGLYVLVTPMYNAVYPRFSALVASGDFKKLGNLYRLCTRILSIILFPTAMILAVFAYDLVRIWTGNTELASSVAPVVTLLAIGSALNCIMFIPHALQLAFGMTRLPLIINGALMIVILPLIVFFTLTYGVLGGAMAWLTLHALYVLLGTWLTHRHLLRGLGKQWLFRDVGVPLGVALIAGMAAKYICQNLEYSIYIKLAIGGSIALLTVVVNVLLTPQLLLLISRYFHSKQVVDTGKN
ncbi:MAG: oligosaccharide flippase family protein [Candidatus Nitrotoga sp.]|nr:oligosaccharide flippase family protein [Candidatus Nitrotoga sp.]MDP1855103.1 oligosaccharide flippase family protein [Candidatus Nitrotoga sp.]